MIGLFVGEVSDTLSCHVEGRLIKAIECDIIAHSP
jgi:hypothetical protein